jgi:hypothetical protein
MTASRTTSSKDKMCLSLGGLEEFRAWCSRRSVIQTRRPVSGMIRPEAALARQPSETPELTRQCIVDMVREKAPGMMEPEAGIRFAAKCGLCKRTLTAVGPRDGRRSQFKMHWLGNEKCVGLRDSWTTHTYDMEEIERVFLTVQPVDGDKERAAYLLRRCASVQLFVDTLAEWCSYMNGDTGATREWITRTLINDATPEHIAIQTERFSAIMRSLLMMEYARTAARLIFPPTPDNSDSEGPATGASSSGVLAGFRSLEPPRMRRRSFTRKLSRPKPTSANARFVSRNNLNTCQYRYAFCDFVGLQTTHWQIWVRVTVQSRCNSGLRVIVEEDPARCWMTRNLGAETALPPDSKLYVGAYYTPNPLETWIYICPACGQSAWWQGAYLD